MGTVQHAVKKIPKVVVIEGCGYWFERPRFSKRRLVPWQKLHYFSFARAGRIARDRLAGLDRVPNGDARPLKRCGGCSPRPRVGQQLNRSPLRNPSIYAKSHPSHRKRLCDIFESQGDGRLGHQ